MKKTNNFNILLWSALHMFACGAIYYGISIIQWNYPIETIYFLMEDSWSEYITFVNYIISGVLILILAYRKAEFRHPGYVLFALGFIFIAMEEISWGQRILGLETPYVIAKRNYQSELNLHNLSSIDSKMIFIWGLLIWTVAIPLLSRISRKVESVVRNIGIPLLSIHFIPYFLLGLFVSIEKAFVSSGELSEFLFSICIVIFTTILFYKNYLNTRPTSSPIANMKYGSSIVIIILTLTYLFIKITPIDSGTLRGRFLSATKGSYYEFGYYMQIQSIFEYVRNNEQLRNADVLYKYGLFLEETNLSEPNLVFEDALKEAEIEKSVMVGKPSPYILTGNILKKMGRLDQSAQEYMSALRINEERLKAAEFDWEKVTALRSLGDIHVALNDYDEANNYYLKALEFKPVGHIGVQIRKSIEGIMDETQRQ